MTVPPPSPALIGNGKTESIHNDSVIENSAKAEHPTTLTKGLDSTRMDVPLIRPPPPARFGIESGLATLEPIGTTGRIVVIAITTITTIEENLETDSLLGIILKEVIPEKILPLKKGIMLLKSKTGEVTTVTNETTQVVRAKHPLSSNALRGMMIHPWMTPPPPPLLKVVPRPTQLLHP